MMKQHAGRLKYGPEIICHIVANQSDCFLDGESMLQGHSRPSNP